MENVSIEADRRAGLGGEQGQLSYISYNSVIYIYIYIYTYVYMYREREIDR